MNSERRSNGLQRFTLHQGVLCGSLENPNCKLLQQWMRIAYNSSCSMIWSGQAQRKCAIGHEEVVPTKTPPVHQIGNDVRNTTMNVPKVTSTAAVVVQFLVSIKYHINIMCSLVKWSELRRNLESGKLITTTVNPFPFEWVLRALIDFTLSNARRFYSSMGNLLDGKELTTSKTMSLLNGESNGKWI